MHKKCAQHEGNQIIDLCILCRKESFPFLLCTNDELTKEQFNSLEICKPCLSLEAEEGDKINIDFIKTDILDLFDNIHENKSHNFDSDNTDLNILNNVNFDFYDLHKFHTYTKKGKCNSNFSLLHSNIESLCAKEDRLKIMLTNLDFSFDVIALSETWNPDTNDHKFLAPFLEGYHVYEGTTGNTMKGGCGFYIKNSLNYVARHDLDFKSHSPQHDFECKWVEMVGKNPQDNLIIGVHYRHPFKYDKDYLKYLIKILDLIKKENKNVVITGDFNYNLLNYQTNTNINDFLSSLLGHLYLPHILGPTRITDKKPSLIDNIFFNNLDKHCTSGNLLYKLSDHLPSFIFIDNTNYSQVTRTKRNNFKRDFSKFNQDRFNEMIKDPKIINDINSINDTNKKYEILHKHIINTLDDLAPYKKVTRKKIKQLQKPWITTGILKSITRKNGLYKKFLLTKDTKDYIKYKSCRDLLNRLIRKNKRTYYNNYFRSNINNIKKIWTGINELTNRKPKNSRENITLTINEEIVSDPTKVANHFNTFFTSVAKKLTKKMKTSDTTFNEYLKTPNETNIFVQPTCTKEVKILLASIDPNKSPDVYGISPKIIKLASDSLAPTLMGLIFARINFREFREFWSNSRN